MHNALVLREAFLGVDRFEDFITRLDISRAALSSRLGWMVEAGVMERVPPEGKRAAYRLTAGGKALRPTFDAIKAWGDEWLPRATKENSPGVAGPSIY